MCYMEPNCVSINIGPLDEGKHKCELNNITEENHAPFLLENKPGFTYLAIEVIFHILIKPRGVRHKSCVISGYYGLREKLHKAYFLFPTESVQQQSMFEQWQLSSRIHQ